MDLDEDRDDLAEQEEKVVVDEDEAEDEADDDDAEESENDGRATTPLIALKADEQDDRDGKPMRTKEADDKGGRRAVGKPPRRRGYPLAKLFEATE